MTKKILMVVANPGMNTNLNWPVGFWASELIHPYDAFIKKGYEVTIASPNGGKVKVDALSDPRDESGYSAWDKLSESYLNNPDFTKKLENTVSVDKHKANEFDAIVVAGGQSPMFTFEKATSLHQLFSDFYSSGKPSAALCHGTAILRWAKDSSGNYLVSGKQVTGFTNAEEDEADKAVGQKVMPWRIEDTLTSMDAHFRSGQPWENFAVRDGNLITGQQQMSGGKTAELVINALEN